MTIVINANCELIGSRKTCMTVYREMQSIARKQRWERDCYKVLARARAEWERTGSAEAWDFYSDYHKDVYGVRP